MLCWRFFVSKLDSIYRRLARFKDFLGFEVLRKLSICWETKVKADWICWMQMSPFAWSGLLGHSRKSDICALPVGYWNNRAHIRSQTQSRWPMCTDQMRSNLPLLRCFRLWLLSMPLLTKKAAWGKQPLPSIWVHI